MAPIGDINNVTETKTKEIVQDVLHKTAVIENLATKLAINENKVLVATVPKNLQKTVAYLVTDPTKEKNTDTIVSETKKVLEHPEIEEPGTSMDQNPFQTLGRIVDNYR